MSVFGQTTAGYVASYSAGLLKTWAEWAKFTARRHMSLNQWQQEAATPVEKRCPQWRISSHGPLRVSGTGSRNSTDEGFL